MIDYTAALITLFIMAIAFWIWAMVSYIEWRCWDKARREQRATHVHRVKLLTRSHVQIISLIDSAENVLRSFGRRV